MRGVVEEISQKDYDKKRPISNDSDNAWASTAVPTSKRSLAISASKYKFDEESSVESLGKQETDRRPKTARIWRKSKSNYMRPTHSSKNLWLENPHIK